PLQPAARDPARRRPDRCGAPSSVWFAGFLALLALVIYSPNPLLIIILLLSGSELWRRWRMRRVAQMQEYYRVRPQQRLVIGLLYFGLAAALAVGMHATHVPHSF